MMLTRLRQFGHEQNFHPGWLAPFTNPFFIARRGLERAVKALAPEMTGRLLDVGCGSKPYQRFFRVREYVGLDIETPRTKSAGIADHFYDGHRFPFASESFDSVLCNQVLEHVFNPHDFLNEMHRVLKPGGRVLLTVPFVWDEHEQPLDFARYSSFGLRFLLERSGFQIEQHRKINGDVGVIFQMFNAYLHKVLPKALVVQVIACAVVMAPISYLGVLLSRILPDNQDLYLDQVILARKVPA